MASPVSILCALLGSLPASALFTGPDCHPPKLELSVTVNGRPASGDPLIRTGGQVRVVYRLSNAGDGDVDDIRLAAADATIVCPSGTGVVPKLEEHSSVVCTATLSAAAGSHDGTVTATGHAWDLWPYDDDHEGGHRGDHDNNWQRSVSVSAPVGYRGVGGLIAATDSVSVAPTTTGGLATLAYTITDTGNLPVFVTLSDPLVPSGKISCGAGSTEIQPGAVAHCSATVDLAPGAHTSTLSVTGSDRTSTAGSDGGTIPPPTLSASASTGFTVVALPPLPPPTPTPTPVPPRPTPTPTPAPIPPPPTTPAPSPSRAPTQPPTPTPPPTTRPTPPPPPRPSTPAPSPTPEAAPPVPKPAQLARPGVKTPLFLLVMMMPAAGAAAVLAARRK